MNINGIVDESRRIRTEAGTIIVRKGLDALLTLFGRPVYGGSYHLDLMTWRDLDVYLIADDHNDRAHFMLGEGLAELCRPFKMSYRSTVGTAAPRMPCGRYWGVHTERFFNAIWKIDCWVISERETVKHLKTLVKLKGMIDERERPLIMRIKHRYCHHPAYRRDFTSMDIYTAVCRNGVGSLSAFRRWLKCERGLA